MTSQKLGKASERTERVCAFLRRQHPFKTGSCIEADTGIAADTFRKWDAGFASPSFSHFITLISAYGPEFLAQVFDSAPDWLSAAVRAERMAALNAEIEQRKAALAELERA